MEQFIEKPEYIDLTVTGACNLSCPYCYASAGKPLPGELSREELARLADEIVAWRIGNVDVDGGEPLLREDLFDVLDRFREIRKAMVLITNGTLVDGKNAERLKATGIRRVSFSLDGGSAAVHGATRGATFEKILGAIDLLQRRGLWVAVNTVILRHNYRGLKGLVELCIARGVRVLNMEACMPYGRGAGSPGLLMAPEEWEFLGDFLPYAASVKDAVRIELFLPSTLEPWIPAEWRAHFRREGCRAGTSHVAVLSDGRVLPCHFLMDFPGFTAGNVREAPLREIWERSPVLARFRRTEPKARCPWGLEAYLTFVNRE